MGIKSKVIYLNLFQSFSESITEMKWMYTFLNNQEEIEPGYECYIFYLLDIEIYTN